jgi:hypothetical protein
MSDTFLHLIPNKPNLVPEKLNQDRAKKYLDSFFKNANVEFVETDDIEFVNPMANFENVYCNLCGRDIKIESWQYAIEQAYKSKLKDISFVTPCCQKTTNLNDLNYQWPAGFAKFTISISKPPEDINEDQLKELENILGTKIRKIWAHY